MISNYCTDTEQSLHVVDNSERLYDVQYSNLDYLRLRAEQLVVTISIRLNTKWQQSHVPLSVPTKQSMANALCNRKHMLCVEIHTREFETLTHDNNSREN